MAKATKCPGHVRHWFAPAAYIRSPACVRCGAPNPRPLSPDELEEYEDFMASMHKLYYGTEESG